jgi:hypothetical protein
MSFRFAVYFLFAASATHVSAQEPVPSEEAPSEEARAPDSAAPDSVAPDEAAQTAPEAAPAEEEPEPPAGDELSAPPEGPEATDQTEAGATVDPTPDEAIEEEELESAAPWRGSEIEFRNAVGAVNFSKSVDLTYNPYYGVAFSIRPRWWFGDQLNLRARFDVATELTNADDTTTRNEPVVSDLWISVGASPLYTIPVVEIDIAPDLRLTFPTSLVSQARTMLFALSPGVAFQRVFDLGAGHSITVAYRTRFSFLFHESQTAERDEPIINPLPGGLCSPDSCGQFYNTGVRNAQYQFSHGGDVIYQPLEWFSFGISILQIFDFLYDLEPREDISHVPVRDTSTRHRTFFGVEATFTPFDALEIGFGAETLGPQLDSSSNYYFPLFNRYTALYLDLRLKIEGLVDAITGRHTRADDEEI